MFKFLLGDDRILELQELSFLGLSAQLFIVFLGSRVQSIVSLRFRIHQLVGKGVVGVTFQLTMICRLLFLLFFCL